MTTAYLRVILSMEILISYAPYRHQRYSSTNSLKRTAVCMVKERVCFPYEFTLLSNVAATCTTDGKFVSPTNLHCSQTIVLVLSLFIGLFPLRIYTALKQSLLIGLNGDSLFPLRIYTALKQRFYRVLSLPGLFPLRIYTALKLFTLFSIYSIRLFPLRIYTALKLTQKPRKSIKVCFPYEFTLLSNLKSSKNNILQTTRVPS